MITGQGLGAGLVGSGVGGERVAVALSLVHEAGALTAAARPFSKELHPPAALGELLTADQVEVLEALLARTAA